MRFSITIDGDTNEPRAQELFKALDLSKPISGKSIEVELNEMEEESNINLTGHHLNDDTRVEQTKSVKKTFADYKEPILDPIETKVIEDHGEYVSSHTLKKYIPGLSDLPTNFFYKWTIGSYGFETIPIRKKAESGKSLEIRVRGSFELFKVATSNYLSEGNPRGKYRKTT